MTFSPSVDSLLKQAICPTGDARLSVQCARLSIIGQEFPSSTWPRSSLPKFDNYETKHQYPIHRTLSTIYTSKQLFYCGIDKSRKTTALLLQLGCVTEPKSTPCWSIDYTSAQPCLVLCLPNDMISVGSIVSLGILGLSYMCYLNHESPTLVCLYIISFSV